MKRFFILIFSALCLVQNLLSQDTSELVLDFVPFDYPYSLLAAQTVSNSATPQATDYLRAYANPSMSQSLAATSSLTNLTFWGLSKIKFDISQKFWINSLMTSLAYVGAEIFLEYSPLGLAWLHEEYHRAILTKNFVNSYDEANDFKFFAEIIRVTDVKDEDLIRFKAENPGDFVRLHAAGVEGENVLAFRLYEYQIFENQTYPYYFLTSTSLLNTFFYIYICHTQEAEITTEQENAADGTNIAARDFTGLDFTAWIYDLQHFYEPYENRGIHPSGVGIDRYVKPSDLSDTALKILKKEAWNNTLNFISPFFFGIGALKSKKNPDVYYNFSFRHLLTSFGNDIAFYLFRKNGKNKFVFALHKYKSYFNPGKFYPGLEFRIYQYPLSFGKVHTFNNLSLMTWYQNLNPQKSYLGGLIEYQINVKAGNFYPYVDISAKTPGWVAGNEFLDKNISLRFGLSYILRR